MGASNSLLIKTFNLNIKMKKVLTHFVQMDVYYIPDGIKNAEAYILENELEPDETETRDWEVVDIY